MLPTEIQFTFYRIKIQLKYIYGFILFMKYAHSSSCYLQHNFLIYNSHKNQER